MIDVHCHLLPALDDGARDLATSVAMARMAVEEGVTTVACTPHILPGVYDNHGVGIETAVCGLAKTLAAENIPLRLVAGADIHIAPDLVAGLKAGRIPTLAGSRYLLLELPHDLPPPRIEQTAFELMTAGYHPILTHPERLGWIESEFGLLARLVHCGAWVQVTAGSLTGRFGRRARYWSERLLDEGLVHVLATDAHDTRRRPPLLHEASRLAAHRVGKDEAKRLVHTRPRAVLSDADPATVWPPPAVVQPLRESVGHRRWGFWSRRGGWC